MARLDPEDNQQTLQQESATELATVATVQEDFLWDLCDNAGKHIGTFFRNFMMAQGIAGPISPVFFISQ